MERDRDHPCPMRKQRTAGALTEPSGLFPLSRPLGCRLGPAGRTRETCPAFEARQVGTSVFSRTGAQTPLDERDASGLFSWFARSSAPRYAPTMHFPTLIVLVSILAVSGCSSPRTAGGDRPSIEEPTVREKTDVPTCLASNAGHGSPVRPAGPSRHPRGRDKGNNPEGSVKAPTVRCFRTGQG